MREVWSLKRNFWSLLIGSFLAAIVSSTAAVWIVSRPFVEQTKSAAIEAIANSAADNVLDRLLPVQNLIGYVATDPHLVALALGDSFNADPIIARLGTVVPPKGLLAVQAFDFAEDRILDYGWDGEPAGPAFDVAMLHALPDLLSGTVSEAAALVSGSPDADRSTIAVAVPIYQAGFAEGAIVALVSIEGLSQHIVSSGDMLADVTLIASEAGATDYAGIARVGGFDIWVAVSRDTRFGNGAVGRFVAQNLAAVSLSLCLPFVLFGFFGQRAIVLPSRQLAQSREDLRESSRKLAELAAVAEMSNDAIILTDREGLITWVNKAFTKISGYSLADVSGTQPGRFLQGPKSDQNAIARIRTALREVTPISLELINYNKAKEPYWIRLSISPLFDQDGQHYGFMSISSDITDRKRDESRLAEAARAVEVQALHDELTGLPNRRYFNIELAQRTERDDRRALTIARIDLDHFKYVNDTAGHDAGDHVLIQVADILRTGCRAGDLVVRIGGDEFVILMAPGVSSEAATKACERVQARIRQPMEFDGKQLKIGASFGVASNDGGLLEQDEVLQAADAALYRAKDEGRNKIVLYAPELHSAVVEHRQLADRLRDAVEIGAFVPFYQPQIDAKTGELVGAEVLARWQDEEGAFRAPALWIDAAEQMGILTEIDRIIMNKALAEVGSLSDQTFVLNKLSFNITSTRLTDPDLINVLNSAQSDRCEISLEILETVFLDGGRSNCEFALDGLREAGFRIEIDDFGSGHASMISLMRVRPDALKIDRQIVMGAPNSPAHQEMVQAVVRIASALDIEVIAEGVESPEHVAMMQLAGCDTLQGFHFAKPMPFQDLLTFSKARIGSGDIEKPGLRAGSRSG